MPVAAVDKRQRIMQIREERNFTVADRYLWNHWSCL